MSIKDIQTAKAIRRILLEELKSGVVPDGHTLDYKLSKYFNENYPGYPVFKPITAESRKIMSLEDYNKMLNMLADDLETLYLSLLEQNMQIINNFVYYENERNKKAKQIYALSLLIDELITKSNRTNPYSHTIIEGFNDFLNIDLKNTTAFVDLSHGNVSLFPDFEKTDQVSLKNADIQITKIFPEGIEHKELANVENCLNDYIDSSWMHEIILPEQKTKIGQLQENKITQVGIELEINLKKNVLASQIELESTTKDPTFVAISVSSGDNEWVAINDDNNILDHKIQIDFPARTIKKIKIKLTKDVFEYQIDPVLFSLKDISLYYNVYRSEGKLQTLNYKVNLNNNETIDKISLVTKEHIPSGTDITYTIDIKEAGKDDYTYKDMPIVPISRGKSNHEYIDLSSSSKRTILFNHENLIRSMEDDNYNIRFYKYNKDITGKIIKDQSKLFKGINQWERQVYQYAQSSSHNISIENFINIPVVDNLVLNDYTDNLDSKITEYIDYTKDKKEYLLNYSYIDTNSVEIFSYSGSKIEKVSTSKYNVKQYNYNVSDSSYNPRYYIEFKESLDDKRIYFAKYHAKYINYMFTTYIYCNNAQDFETKKIPATENMRLEISNDRGLYINNKSITPIMDNDRRHYIYKGSLAKGWNKITYIGYLNNSKDGLVTDNEVIKIRVVDEDSTSKAVNEIHCQGYRAHKDAMQYTSYYDLINTVLKEENHYYTINGTCLLINSPKICNYKLDLVENINSVEEIRVNAHLTTQNQFLSPKIDELRLNFFYSDQEV